MATQAFIIEQENALVAAQKAARTALEGLNIELAANRGCIDPHNRDCWQTMRLNAQDAVNKITRLIAALNKAL
jgi:hypothetical protein